MHLPGSFRPIIRPAPARPQPGRPPARGFAVAAGAVCAAALAAGCSAAAPAPHVPAGSPRAGTSAPAATATPAAASPAATSAAAPTVPAGGPVPPGFEPVSMTFVSASEGWVLGTAPCAVRPCTSIVRTTDGGASWTGIPAPIFPLASNGPAGLSPGLSYLRFANPLDGFAFGSQLWATHDGGATWQQVWLPGTIGDLETSAGVVYAAVIGQDRTVTIYQGLASGGPWTPVQGLPADIPDPADVAAVNTLGRITLHGTAAWLILGSQLYATQTGQSWAREPVTCPPGYAMASAAAASTQQVTLLCAGDSGMGSQGKSLYSSGDGGASFSLVGMAPTGGDQLKLLAQPTAQHIFIATSSAATWLDVSGGGGRIWGTALSLDDGGLGWSDFGFTTPTQGVAIEGNLMLGTHMYMTWDAGQTWHQITF
jgi:photosystem II stability/assembly factor-like uncharacterized protein